jgi:acyl dehydratase
MSQIKYFWEDLEPGSVRELGSIAPSIEDMKDFAERFDPQPFHLDEAAGRSSIFGNMCASGWHTCALAMKLCVENFLNESSSMGSPGLESLRWLKPVYPGDTLHLRHTILESRPLRKRTDIGLVRSSWDLFNQNDEQVLHMEGYGMFRRRHPATPDEIARLEAAQPKK